jgi:hypothetical protein
MKTVYLVVSSPGQRLFCFDIMKGRAVIGIIVLTRD